MALIGIPLDRDDNTSGLAAARRVFLAAEPIFRTREKADSIWEGLAVFSDRNAGEDHLDQTDAVDGAGKGEREQLQGLVRSIASLADDGRRPALINLLIDLRKHAAHPAAKRLPTPLVRIALPLALAEAGLTPKAAPGLLGGLRLPLGMSRARRSGEPMTSWLKSALEALAFEANASYQRLVELTNQHRAWHQALTKEGLRRHAKAPKALELLAATPVLNIGLVARHVGCSHVAAGKIIERLVDVGILLEQTSRSRHKIFVAGDLSAEGKSEAAAPPLSLSPPSPMIDIDALDATLDGLFADLDRATHLAQDSAAISGLKRSRKTSF